MRNYRLTYRMSLYCSVSERCQRTLRNQSKSASGASDAYRLSQYSTVWKSAFFGADKSGPLMEVVLRDPPPKWIITLQDLVTPLRVHVRASLDGVGQLRYGHLEAALDLLEHLGILVA